MHITKYPEKGRFSSEGVIIVWDKNIGDTVKKGDLLVEIEASGECIQMESAAEGTLLKVLANTGRFVRSGDPLAVIGKSGEDISKAIKQLEQNKPVSAKQAPKVQPKAKAKPAVEVQVAQSTQPKKEEVMTTPQSTGDPDNVIPILMPQAGQSMEEGTILSWQVKEGDTIEVGQVIMEIETDKATMEVEAVDAGRIARIVACEGDIVEVKVPVAYLAEEGVDVDAHIASGGSAVAPAPKAASKPAPTQSAAPAVQKTPASVTASGRVKASPAARKAAADKGIDLASIGAGSGPGGRILSSDVENADVIPTETQVHTLSKMRRAIANNLLYSKQNIPHFYAKTTIDAGLLFATYRKTKEQFKCSVNDFVTRACAKAIRQYPAFRSQYKGTEVIENPAVNIGIAVGTDEGLTVPVVLGADRMKLKNLSARTREVVESARNGKLEGMGQGVFTITNLGMFGVEEFSAIINPPESAILAVGAIREGVMVENGAMRPSRLMTVTLSVDHRVIDGVLSAQFLKTLKALLEAPEQLVS
jgi:pyruvate dehydrogenase E2 component (dihydrolipoamide acetyltransferase)